MIAKFYYYFLWPICVIYLGYEIYIELHSWLVSGSLVFIAFSIAILNKANQMTLDAQRELIFKNTDRITEVVEFLNKEINKN